MKASCSVTSDVTVSYFNVGTTVPLRRHIDSRKYIHSHIRREFLASGGAPVNISLVPVKPSAQLRTD